jgi:cell wall-associated NlpC family hydrolase
VPIKGGYLIAAGGGAILLWSGIRGKSWSSVLRAVVTGKDPRTSLTAYPITTSQAAFAADSGGFGGGNFPGSASGSAIVSDAMTYNGLPYVWGGVPGHGKGNTDCSGFVNSVVGRDLHMAIPGYKAGTYHGQSHGPVTSMWWAWNGATTIPANQGQAGDLAVWWTHMGILIDSTHMISALDTKDGVKVTTIQGGAPALEKLRIRRLK